jgi:hypothetical protein
MGTGDMGDSRARPSPSAKRRGACSIRLAIRLRRLQTCPDTSTLNRRSPGRGLRAERPEQHDFVLSIKPEYATKIVDGLKKVELRRRFSYGTVTGARTVAVAARLAG